MVRWRMLAVTLLLASGCGGQSERTTGDADSNAGEGGTATGGTGGVAGTIDLGGTGGAAGTDGGTAGSVVVGGTGGTVITGGTGGTSRDGSCVYNGRVYGYGAEFPAGDGCNTCQCRAGAVSCTLIDCPTPEDCSVLSDAYQQNLVIAKECSPNAEFQCQVLVASGLQCSCPTFANYPAQVDTLAAIAAAWSERGCGGGVTCGACPPPPISGYCTSDGSCVDSFRE